jgi:hypothetical protein
MLTKTDLNQTGNVIDSKLQRGVRNIEDHIGLTS